MELSDLVNLIEERRAALGLTMAEVHERAFPGSKATAVQNLKRGIPPNFSTLKKLCDALGLEFYIGAPRSSSPAPEVTVGDELYATVARHEALAEGGNGFINLDTAEVIDRLAFSKTWLLQNGINPANCILISVKGRSMEPSIYEGDLIMIDRNRREIRNGKIYVFNDPEGGTRLKRLDLAPGAAIIIRSDNPDQKKYKPEIITGDRMNAIAGGIIGEVVWSGHKWG